MIELEDEYIKQITYSVGTTSMLWDLYDKMAENHRVYLWGSEKTCMSKQRDFIRAWSEIGWHGRNEVFR